ncbi:MAG TPA: hypothetical protein VFG50_01265 [Rhodothermales bacterium]|nr:hypothetical protein [Rhodothermales bacterium]
MKGINRTGRTGLLLLAVTACFCFVSSPAAAQDSQERADSTEKGQRITIVVGEDGSVTVNGKVVNEGVQAFHLDPGPGDVFYFSRNRHGQVPSAKAPMRFEFQPGDTFEVPSPEEVRDKLKVLRLKDFPMKDFGPFFGDVDFLARENAETIRLEQEARELARKYREAEGAERQRLERDLREKLNKEFDQKLALRRERTEQLQKELKEQQERLQKRQAARDEVIERHLKELLGEEDVLNW